MCEAKVWIQQGQMQACILDLAVGDYEASI